MCLDLIVLVLSKFSGNDLPVVIDYVSTCDAGTTTYLINEVPKSQDLHRDTEIIYVNFF